VLSVFLNPKPSLGDLKFFAYVGSRAAKEQWPEIQEAMRQAATEPSTVEQAIAESGPLFSGATGPKIVPPREH
jgi:hypothetical protein